MTTTIGQYTPVFLPGESHGGKSLVGYSPWGRKESDTTERLHTPPKSLQMVTSAMKLKEAYSLEKAMAILDSILKSRDVTLPTKFRLVKAVVFPVVMYGCGSWTTKKAEH